MLAFARYGFLALLFLASSCAHHRPDTISQENAAELTRVLHGLLNAQADDWNEGKLDKFCSIYTDNAVFIAPSGETIGRNAILERYQKKYSTPEKRGRLTLVPKHTEILGAGTSAAIVLRWKIEKPDKIPAEGWSLVVFKKSQNAWMIVQDASM